MEEQVELDFTVKAPIATMQRLVEATTKNNLVQIVTVEGEELLGPVFLSIPFSSTPTERWEYKVSLEPQWARQSDLEKWLTELGAEGWGVLRIPDDDEGFWYFKRRVR